MIVESTGVAQTEAIAAQLAANFVGGEVIALHGDLGAGKTQFVRGLVRGLGGDPRSVSSPTFAILNIYKSGRLTVFHLDAYRISSPDDFESIGFTELLEQSGVIALEWPDRAAGLLPVEHYIVRITAIGEDQRSIEIERKMPPEC